MQSPEPLQLTWQRNKISQCKQPIEGNRTDSHSVPVLVFFFRFLFSPSSRGSDTDDSRSLLIFRTSREGACFTVVVGSSSSTPAGLRNLMVDDVARLRGAGIVRVGTFAVPVDPTGSFVPSPDSEDILFREITGPADLRSVPTLESLCTSCLAVFLDWGLVFEDEMLWFGGRCTLGFGLLGSTMGEP